jgi:hypothetical protein
MQKQKGFIGLIAILVVVVIGALWMAYLLRGNWLSKSNMNLSGGLPGTNSSADAQPKDINGQLNDLRQNMRTVQNNEDQKINNAMSGK